MRAALLEGRPYALPEGGRDHVPCIVLGAGASVDDCRRWLAAAAAGGYAGFAVGRTLWADEVRAFLAGELDRDSAAARIGDNYRSMAEAYASGYRGPRTAPRSSVDRAVVSVPAACDGHGDLRHSVS